MKKYKIAVAGTGYVGLSIATLLSQHHHVTAVDIVPEKVEMINNRKSPIQDDYIEKYLAEKDLDLTATLDAKDAYTELEIFAEENPPKRVNRPEACGLRHLAFCVDSVEQTVNELVEVGIECEPIRVDDYTGKKMTFFHDPDGLPLELHE